MFHGRHLTLSTLSYKALELYRTQQAFGLLNKTTQKYFANLCSSFFIFHAKVSEHLRVCEAYLYQY